MVQDVYDELRLGLPWQKQYLLRRSSLVASKLGLNVRKKLAKEYLEQSCVWC